MKRRILVFILLIAAALLVTQHVHNRSHKGKCGYIDRNGRMVIEPQYLMASSFSEGLAAVIDGDYVHYIDKSGKAVFKYRRNTGIDVKYKPEYPEEFENKPQRLGDPVEANPFREGMSAVIIKHDYAFINRTGKVVIGPNDSWIDVGNFHCGRAMIQEDHKCGYIDKKGRVVIKPQFALAEDFSEGLACVMVGRIGAITNAKQKKNEITIGINGKFGFIDRSGKMVIKAQYEYARDFYDDLTCIKLKGGKWSFIDKSGKMVLKPQWDDAFPFYKGLAPVKTGNKWGMIDKSGKYVIKPGYSQMGHCSEGLIPVEIKGKHGYIDRSGRIVIKPQFDMVDGFWKGRAKVLVGKRYGFIDKTGRIIIKPRYEEASNFSEGLAAVRL